MDYEICKTGVILIKPSRFVDDRGFFSECFSRRAYSEFGVSVDFVQDNHSFSNSAGTVRGMHFQAPPKAQAKLVRCGRGAVFDVVVDIRVGSPTYGVWEGFEPSFENGHQLFVPVGFAHGFVSLDKNSELVYKCSNYYCPSLEGSINWRDPDIRIKWPSQNKPKLSAKDKKAPQLKEASSPFLYGVNS